MLRIQRTESRTTEISHVKVNQGGLSFDFFLGKTDYDHFDSGSLK